MNNDHISESNGRPAVAEYVLVGLTGSIGAGKSAVAEIFRQNGLPVLSADDIARELMASDPEMIAEIRTAFGPEAYLEGNQLNRVYLAEQIFSDPQKRERMNQIVHPRTIAEQGVRAMHLIEQGNRVVACEAALTLESGGENRFDYIVVVDADRDTRLHRAAERDGVSLAQVQQRDAAQMPAEEKIARADFVIRNDGSPQDLQRNAAFIAGLLKTLPPRHHLEHEDEQDDEQQG